MSDKLLILDIDSTLVFAWYGDEPEWRYDFVVDGDTFVTKRPFVDEFLEYAFKNFRVAIYTARWESSAEEILKGLGIDMSNLEFFYHQDDCELKYCFDGNKYIKDLNLLSGKFGLDKMIILDDNPDGCVRNVDNHIHIDPFYTSPTDQELLKLIPFLETLKLKPDVRSIDKSKWSNNIQAVR